MLLVFLSVVLCSVHLLIDCMDPAGLSLLLGWPKPNLTQPSPVLETLTRFKLFPVYTKVHTSQQQSEFRCSQQEVVYFK